MRRKIFHEERRRYLLDLVEKNKLSKKDVGKVERAVREIRIRKLW